MTRKTTILGVLVVTAIAAVGWLYAGSRDEETADRAADEAAQQEQKQQELSAFNNNTAATRQLQDRIQPSAGGWLFEKTTFIAELPDWRIDCGTSGVHLTFLADDDLVTTLISAELDDTECAKVLPVIGEALHSLVKSHVQPQND